MFLSLPFSEMDASLIPTISEELFFLRLLVVDFDPLQHIMGATWIPYLQHLFVLTHQVPIVTFPLVML